MNLKTQNAPLNTRFQYKICYSKIALFSFRSLLNAYFNTKFVIAKSGFDKFLLSFYIQFQYKICYSKILLLNAQKTKFFEFQYKICYSKILHKRYKNKWCDNEISIQNLL